MKIDISTKIYAIFLSLFLFLKITNAFSASITLTSDENCQTKCSASSAVEDGSITITTAPSMTESFSAGADATQTIAICKSTCEALKQRHSGGIYLAESVASPTSNSFTRVMCNALRVVQGSAGKTFAAFAIIAVGIGFFSGKVSWGLMIGVAAGIAAMFGAPSIVAAISGENTNMNCGNKI